MGRNRISAIFRWLAALLAALCLIFFITSLASVDRQQGEEGRQQLETALRRAAVACYAAEGVYPPTVEYLQQHYGVQIEEERYIVFYEIFANNLMPDITVLEKER
ncbi:MAG: hypothetical protein IJO41_06160 [Oscillospiraceae bacterium]|nr:hypothetical protein [Oscillospiraceae bacterium]MBQ9837564.1 hypothetical protein [Oscillospiraceae bacterium]